MERKRDFTATIRREGAGYTALCPELDVASQGDAADESRRNLDDAVALLLETASASELKHRTCRHLGHRSSIAPLE